MKNFYWSSVQFSHSSSSVINIFNWSSSRLWHQKSRILSKVLFHYSSVFETNVLNESNHRTSRERETMSTKILFSCCFLSETNFFIRLLDEGFDDKSQTSTTKVSFNISSLLRSKDDVCYVIDDHNTNSYLQVSFCLDLILTFI